MVGAVREPPLQKPESPSAIGQAFKTVSTKRLNTVRNTPGVPVWQRNYYEHIVRSEESLTRIRRYIVGNPARWEEDRGNPQR